MTTRRELEYGFYVMKKAARVLNLRDSETLLVDCPSEGCLGMVKIVIDCSGGQCCVTAHCTDPSEGCDFPTLSGPIKWEYEVQETK